MDGRGGTKMISQVVAYRAYEHSGYKLTLWIRNVHAESPYKTEENHGKREAEWSGRQQTARGMPNTQQEGTECVDKMGGGGDGAE